MKKSYRIENIDCANCAEKLQNSLKKIEGVIELKINFLMQKLVLEADSENFSTVLENIKVQAKKIEPKVLIKG
ncbi:cation transporter [Succinispira mobilis]|uniref:cation transporter n=1 Tax=Succinispira mobilis TaxID=78120 RepID=UPI00037209BC|nr:cation transporter [Succinispira mobilis]